MFDVCIYIIRYLIPSRAQILNSFALIKNFDSMLINENKDYKNTFFFFTLCIELLKGVNSSDSDTKIMSRANKRRNQTKESCLRSDVMIHEWSSLHGVKIPSESKASNV